MANESSEHEVVESEEPIDASNLIIGEIILDDENYDEIIVLDLRKPEVHDLWLN